MRVGEEEGEEGTYGDDWVRDTHCAEESWNVILTEVVPEGENETRIFDEDECDEGLCGGWTSEDGRCHERTALSNFPLSS